MTSDERDILIGQYVSAVNRGDLDGVAAVLASANDDPELDRLVSEVNTALYEATPRARTLKEYRSLVKGKVCRWCKARLSGRIEHYDHSAGWLVTGFSQRQWLYTTCPKCKYQWNLVKLGIRR
jgi:hypothetical protein